MNVRIGIKHIIHKRVGEDMVDSFSVEDASLLFPEDDIELVGPLQADVHIKKFDTFLGVTLTNVHVKLKAVCGRCQRPYDHAIEGGESSMREFYIHVPEEFYSEALEDVFSVDTGRNIVDVTEMLRQELFLMLPTATYCDFPDCAAKPEKPSSARQTFQPFAGLKDMLEE